MPPEKAAQVYQEHREWYDGLQRGVARASKSAANIDPDAALAQVAAPTRLY